MDKSRPKILLIFLYIIFSLILGKLFYIQVISGQELHEQALSQIYKIVKIFPRQGKILSRDKYPLSLGYSYYSLALYKPNFKNDLDEILTEITSIKSDFATQNAQLIDKFKNPNQKWLQFKGEFNTAEKNKLSKTSGLEFELKQRRYYPEGDLAKDLVLNLEKKYLKQISGQVGFKRNVVDGTGIGLLTRKNWQKNEIDGQDLHTTIDRKIQKLAEDTLKIGLATYQAESASLIILEPQSGEILAMATVEASPSANFTIKNIGHLFEPGSIFKPLVIASALDSNSINQNWNCPNCNQPRKIGEYTINNWDKQVHPDTNLFDTIKNSDNISMSYINSAMGLNKFLEYYQRLKLNQKTGVELVGESISPLKDYWSDIVFATASFGQGIAVNQLQMVQAFNTLANDGKLVKAHINQNTPIQSSSVFSTKTTDFVKKLLIYGVNNSPVSKLKDDDMIVCAKSGTAQVAVEGEYQEDNTIGSYIGFYPCNQPKFTMIVTLNNPKASQWGSSTAAPLWFSLARDLDSLL